MAGCTLSSGGTAPVDGGGNGRDSSVNSDGSADDGSMSMMDATTNSDGAVPMDANVPVDSGSDAAPTAETCNAMDDDQDNKIDEGACTGCDVERWRNHNYLFCRDGAVTWEGAKSSCAGLGYHLVTINDADENTWIGDKATGRKNGFNVVEGWWIGLSRNTTPGWPAAPMPNLWVWSWVSGTSTYGTTPTTPPWASGQPDNGNGYGIGGFPNSELCVEIGYYGGGAANGYWNDLPCKVSQLGPSTTRRWVCELDH